jgi:hypothetical protein
MSEKINPGENDVVEYGVPIKMPNGMVKIILEPEHRRLRGGPVEPGPVACKIVANLFPMDEDGKPIKSDSSNTLRDETTADYNNRTRFKKRTRMTDVVMLSLDDNEASDENAV